MRLSTARQRAFDASVRALLQQRLPWLMLLLLPLGQGVITTEWLAAPVRLWWDPSADLHAVLSINAIWLLFAALWGAWVAPALQQPWAEWLLAPRSRWQRWRSDLRLLLRALGPVWIPLPIAVVYAIHESAPPAKVLAVLLLWAGGYLAASLWLWRGLWPWWQRGPWRMPRLPADLARLLALRDAWLWRVLGSGLLLAFAWKLSSVQPDIGQGVYAVVSVMLSALWLSLAPRWQEQRQQHAAFLHWLGRPQGQWLRCESLALPILLAPVLCLLAVLLQRPLLTVAPEWLAQLAFAAAMPWLVQRRPERAALWAFGGSISIAVTGYLT